MKIWMIVLTVLLVLAVPTVFVMFHGMDEIKRLVIHEVDLARVPDGTYAGSFHKGRWMMDVDVTVKDHRIVAIKNTNPKMDAIKDFFARAEATILQKQTIRVDVVSGASINTKAYQKAVELALSSATQR